MKSLARLVHLGGCLIALSLAIVALGMDPTNELRIPALALGLAAVVTAITPITISFIKEWFVDRKAHRESLSARDINSRLLADALDRNRELALELAERDKLVKLSQARITDLIEAVRTNRHWVEQCILNKAKLGEPCQQPPALSPGLLDPPPGAAESAGL